MMWFNGIGSGWAGCIQEFLVMVVLWGTVITAIILAVRFLTKQRSDPLARSDSGSIRIEYVLAEGSAQGEMDSHQWHRRLM
jgi:putative membrane protein